MEIFLVFVCLTILGLIGHGLQIWAIRSALSRPSSSSDYCPPVSILKPLKGLDDELFGNLESICLQDYPQYEIIFSLQSYNDHAYKVAKKIKDRYPRKKITILVEECSTGLNPKVNNLIPAYRAAKYDLILVSDSNVAVEENYLKETIQYMEDPEVGLVSNLIKGVGGRTAGSILENLHLNSFIIGSICLLDKLKIPCVVGKSMLIRKTDLEAIGGFEATKDFLAEDYIIGKRIHERGRKVILAGHIIKNVNKYWKIKKFFSRHIRWGRLRWKIGGAGYFPELLGNTTLMSCLPILLWEPSKMTLAFAVVTSLIKILGNLYVGRKIKAEMNYMLYFLLPLKDLIMGFIWFIPIISSRVTWRGKKYIVGKDSSLLTHPEPEAKSWRWRITNAIKTKLRLA